MRTIKSQDGKMIVNAKKLSCIIKNKVNTHKGYSAYCISCSWWRNDFIEIAEYSTETRALRVLDMLNEWLTENTPQESEFNNMSAYAGYCIAYNRYQMPKDNEELDA